MDQFWAFADQFVLFSQREKDAVAEKLYPRSFAKRETIVDLGDVAREFYFVLSGYLRFYYLADDGREITGFIFKPGMTGSSGESFFSQTESLQVLEAVTDAETLAMSFTGLSALYRDVPKVNALVRKILEQRLVYAQRVLASLIMQKPEERYGQFVEEQPELLRDIPQHILASYLGITPVSLSRIRRRRLEKGDGA